MHISYCICCNQPFLSSVNHSCMIRFQPLCCRPPSAQKSHPSLTWLAWLHAFFLILLSSCRPPVPPAQNKLLNSGIYSTDGNVARRTLVVCPLCVVSAIVPILFLRSVIWRSC